MKRYVSHKIVEAGVIIGISQGPDIDVAPWVDVEGFGRINVPRGFTARGTPEIGDYLVKYEDGYLSWSPKEAFEQGYTEENN